MLVKRRRTRPIPPDAEIIERDGRKHARWVTARGKTRTMPLNRRGDRLVQESRCRRVFGDIGANTVSDVTSSRAEACLAELRRGGMSPSTSNHYLRALRNFMRWMVRNRPVREDPLAGMRLLRITTADKRRRRRNLSDDEMAALVAAARRSLDPFMGLPGPDRAMLYIVAANTGLRASELASLVPKSFDLTGSRATVRCFAAYTKNGEEAVLPLRSDVAAAIREWRAGKPADERLWPGEWPSQRHGAEMIRIDLTAADIDYEDASGRVADFRALRDTFISNLARAGVHPRNAQALARHSTIDPTMNVYTHVAMGDLHDDVESLAGLVATVAPRPGEPRSAPSRRTPRPPNSKTWSRRGAICLATSVLQDHCGLLIGATGFASSG